MNIYATIMPIPTSRLIVHFSSDGIRLPLEANSEGKKHAKREADTRSEKALTTTRHRSPSEESSSANSARWMRASSFEGPHPESFEPTSLM